MPTITDSSTIDFTVRFDYDAGLIEGDFVTAPGPQGGEYVAQIVHTESTPEQVEAEATVLGSFPDLPFKQAAEVWRADPAAVRSALELAERGAAIGSLRQFDATVRLPIEPLMAKQIGVYGRTGSGKSYTAGVLVEGLLAAGQPVVIVDPHGEYASLKVRAGGEPSDFRVIEYAHPEFNPLADRPIDPDAIDVTDLVRPGQATILNLRGLGSERSQDVAAELLEQLHLERMRDRVPPAKLFLEEAHQFAPRRKNDTRPVVEDVAKEGRKFGFTMCFISQRPSEMYSNVRGQQQATFVHKLTDSTDIDKIVDITEGIDTSWSTQIQKLPQGEALVAGDLVASPTFVDVRARETVHQGGAAGRFSIDEFDLERIAERQADLEERTAAAAYETMKQRVADLQEQNRRLRGDGDTSNRTVSDFLKGYTGG